MLKYTQTFILFNSQFLFSIHMSLGTIFTHQGWNVKLFLAPVVGHVPGKERANKLIRHQVIILTFPSLFSFYPYIYLLLFQLQNEQ